MVVTEEKSFNITTKKFELSFFDFKIKLINDVKLVRSNQYKNNSSQSFVEIGILFLMVSIHSFGDVDIINGVNRKSAKIKKKFFLNHFSYIT